MPDGTTTVILAREIEHLKQGDAAARERLIVIVNERLQNLAHHMLQGFPRVQGHVGTEEVAQDASIRLWKALEKVAITDVLHFLNLATLEIRRELLELARKLAKRPEILPLRQPTGTSGSDLAPTPEPADATYEPRRLAQWAEFHEKIAALPERERSVFELRWYHNLENREIAEQLGISVVTVGRAWTSAKRQLYDLLDGEIPS